MFEQHYDIAIIGGGASGLMLAANLDLQGKSGIILEGSPRLGSKLLMSGGGHCNITHSGHIKDFPKAYGDAGRRLRKCLYRHSNLDLIKWFEENGLKLVEKEGRVFPSTMKSKDVLNVLLSASEKNNWRVETGRKVAGLAAAGRGAGIEAEGDDCRNVLFAEGGVSARNIVIATGGITYPETGSDGSMLRLLSEFGVEITEMHPALSPVYVSGYPYSDLSGISISDVTVTCTKANEKGGGKDKNPAMTGDLLFTHNGFSGPVILNISKYAKPGTKIVLSYNKELDELPRRMQAVLKKRAGGPSGDVRTSVLTALLDHDEFVVSDIDSRGMVTSGGVSLDEIDLSSMRLKRFSDLDSGVHDTADNYVIGEAIDADGITGGYNLQLCWSTACAAADSLKSQLFRGEHDTGEQGA